LLKRTFKAFEYRNFRMLWLGACTSSIGTWMQKLAQAWLVLELSDSAFLLGLDAFLGEIPIFLFSLLGGVAADRRDRRHLLLFSQVVQMGCAFLLAALFAFQVAEVWHILCLSFVVGLAQAFGGPAYQALLPALVELKDLSNAIALNSIQFNLARVIGPVLGGLALTKLGAAWCFSLNAVSYAAPIVALMLLDLKYSPGRTQLSMLDSLKQGLSFIRGHAAMQSLFALAFSIAAFGIPLIVFLPVFARDVFGQDAGTYTLLLSIYGSGSILGALLVAAMGQSGHKGRTMLLMMICLGLTTVGFSLSQWLVLSCMFLFFAGVCLVGASAQLTSLVQEVTADEMRGRVMSVFNVAFRGGMPIGSLGSGALVPHFTAPLVVAANGILIAAVGVYFLLAHRKVAAL
jgi:predicted MFS family arabinose efflux permease